jgi:hypothetical protein
MTSRGDIRAFLHMVSVPSYLLPPGHFIHIFASFAFILFPSLPIFLYSLWRISVAAMNNETFLKQNETCKFLHMMWKRNISRIVNAESERDIRNFSCSEKTRRNTAGIRYAKIPNCHTYISHLNLCRLQYCAITYAASVLSHPTKTLEKHMKLITSLE